MSCIADLLDYFLYQLALFFHDCGMPNWNECVFVGIVQENTFQASLGAVNKESRTPRRRTCSRSLKYTRSVVCLKNGENSASQFL